MCMHVYVYSRPATKRSRPSRQIKQPSPCGLPRGSQMKIFFEKNVVPDAGVLLFLSIICISDRHWRGGFEAAGEGWRGA